MNLTYSSDYQLIRMKVNLFDLYISSVIYFNQPIALKAQYYLFDASATWYNVCYFDLLVLHICIEWSRFLNNFGIKTDQQLKLLILCMC